METNNNTVLHSFEDIVLSQDVVKSFIYKNLPGYRLHTVKGDGLCMFHSFSEGMFSLRGFMLPVEEIKSTLESYLSSHKDRYSYFCEENIDIIDELDKLFENPLANYTNDTTDIYLKAMGDAYKVNIVVFQSDAEKCWIINMSDDNPHADTLYFARTLSVHVDPVLPYSNIKNQTPTKHGCMKSAKRPRLFDMASFDNMDTTDTYIYKDIPCFSGFANNEGEEEDEVVVIEDDQVDKNSEVKFETVHKEFIIDYANPTSDTLFKILLLNPTDHEISVLPKGIRENFMFTTKEKIDNVLSDDNGAYLYTASTAKEFTVEIDRSSSELKSKMVHMDASGEFYYKKRVGRSYETVLVERESVYVLHRYYRKSKSFPGLRQLIIRVSPVQNTPGVEHCCVVYSYLGEAFGEQQKVLPHGNSTKRTRSYVRTTKETLSKIDNHLSNGKSTQDAYDTALNESGGPLKSQSQSKQPRDHKQIYNRKNKLQHKEKQKKTVQSDNNDDMYTLLHQLHENDMVYSVTVKKNSYFFTVMSDDMINDIKQFCCNNNASVLGIDTTFNLCDMWVTDTCYRNKRLTNPENGQHPIFLGPTLFHFTKDEQTFSRLALEMIDAEPSLRSIRSIGVDLEEAISNGFKRIIPNADILYCVRHLQQRDYAKLEKITADMKVSVAEKNHAKSVIIKDIYGERSGACYEYGLAESLDQEDFEKKLAGLETKWEGLCPGFHKWFCDQRMTKFIRSVICSARAGTDVAGLFYQNDIESLHFVEKKRQQFRKEGVIAAIEGLKALADNQRVEEVRALHGAGRYELSVTHQKFLIDSAKWHSWSEERRKNHIEVFKNYEPTFSDKFKKPKGQVSLITTLKQKN